jgi:alpha-D-xyloside xylohydrolase
MMLSPITDWLRRPPSAAALLVAALAGCATTPAVEQTADGVIVTPAEGPAARVRLQVMNERIIRVTAIPTGTFDLPSSLQVVATSGGAAFRVAQAEDVLTLSTARARAAVSLQTGLVTFSNGAGEAVLSEVVRDEFRPVAIDGERFYAIRQRFNRDTDEGVYGLGQHQNGQFNYNGEDVVLAQHNIVDVVPFFVSSRNYGVLWDNNGITRFGDPRDYEGLDASLTVYDETGVAGGLTGRYYRDDELVVTRVESDPDFQYLPPDQYLHEGAARGAWPDEFGERSPSRITWEGAIEAQSPGMHKFRVYASSYVKVWIDGALVVDRWRQNWNPWYFNFDLQMRPGERHDVRVEWLPNGGYFRMLHLDPLPETERHALSLSSEVARAVDYYFIAGEDLDDVIAGYRELTGPAVMLPRWAYGFWQSRQRYTTQEEVLSVLRAYRRRHIPIDNMVLDWFYWREDQWGSHEFDPARFPDPRAMVDEVHRRNAQIMISVWPKFYPTTAHYRELEAAGLLYRRQIEMRSRDWVGPGYPSTFYDPYSPQGREIFWRQIRENLDVLGFDAWWMDATEPDMQSNLSIDERIRRMGPTAAGPGAEFFNSYVLMQSRAMFEGEQQVDPNDRVFILTRSTFGGLQRYGSASWSGDVAARWDDLREQVSAGVNLSLSGLPNWTHDIGGFSVEERYANEDPEHLAEWRELNLRWFQFGAFSPLFRSHGEYPHREIFNLAPDGSVVQSSLIWYDRLRYRLLPYIYTLAGDTYHRHGTIMRALIMDFPNDPKVRDMGDQYLFGPAFLVAPVTEFGARMRNVYLPAGTRWYDFHTGRVHEGGQTVAADAPLARAPLFVRAGSIVPTGPAVEYTGQDPDGAITLLVYAGADGAFDLYEDDGETYAHQGGAFTRIPIRYDDASGTVTIGVREGEYPGMAVRRTFHVRWIAGPSRGAADFDARPDRTVRYAGAEVTVRPATASPRASETEDHRAGMRSPDRSGSTSGFRTRL